MPATATIYKDEAYSTSRPWTADVELDGVKHVSAYYGYKTKKSLVHAIENGLTKITIN